MRTKDFSLSPVTVSYRSLRLSDVLVLHSVEGQTIFIQLQRLEEQIPLYTPKCNQEAP